MTESLKTRYPVLLDVIAALALLDEGQPSQLDVDRVEGILDEVNPHFPTDSVTRMSMANLLTQGHLDAHQLKVVKTIMPDELREKSIRLRASEEGVSCTFSGHLGKDGPYRRITLEPTGKTRHSFAYPIAVTVERFSDMDNPEYHSEYCPVVWGEGLSEAEFDHLADTIEDYATECNCESFITGTSDHLFTVDHATAENWRDATLAAMREWIAKAIWEDA